MKSEKTWSQDPAVKKTKLAAELANGRLAMVALMAMLFQILGFNQWFGAAWWFGFRWAPRKFSSGIGIRIGVPGEAMAPNH